MRLHKSMDEHGNGGYDYCSECGNPIAFDEDCDCEKKRVTGIKLKDEVDRVVLALTGDVKSAIGFALYHLIDAAYGPDNRDELFAKALYELRRIA